MFTGIITHSGTIAAREDKEKSCRMRVSTDMELSDVAIGASIACSGVCLTVVEKGDGGFMVDVSHETMACSTAGSWREGTHINLERSLKMGDELGGHLVYGHVDGMASIAAITAAEDHWMLEVEVPEVLTKFMAVKGSITLDGVSLTVNDVQDGVISLNIIPHTWQVTTLSSRSVGDRVNVEVDMLARYVHRVVSGGS